MSENVSRIYQFLAKFGTDSNGNAGWVANADCKKEDGVITKAEFRQFMEENFEWNGEISNKDDLINEFWSKVDKKTSGKIGGTKLFDKNALNKDEQKNMVRTIRAYEAVENTVKGLSTTVVGNSTAWQASIREGLINKIEEEFLKSNRSIDEIDDYIAQILPGIQRKATADYCAQEYIANTMSYAVNNYNYKYGDDAVLKNIIDSYVNSLATENVEDTEIQEKVQQIVDAYKATAEEGATDEQLELLAQYGYKINQNTVLNDLQKAIVTGTLKEAMKAVESEADFSNYKDLYDGAIEKFIEEKLNGAKFEDFNELMSIGFNDFKESKQYKGIQKSISVDKFMSSDALKEAITKAFGATLAEKIIYNGEYLPSMKEIKKSAFEKAGNGEFDRNGELDMDKVTNYLISEIRKHLAEFYSGDLSKMSLTELEQMYDGLRSAAEEETDSTKKLELIRDAAIKYCKGLSGKSTTLANAVTEILGGNYNTVFKEMLPSVIDEKILEIKAKAQEIGDVADFKGNVPASAWGTLPDTVSLKSGEQVGYKFAETLDINGREISRDRISYSSNNSAISIDDSGNVKVVGTTSCKVKVSILVDGVEVGSKEVNVKVQEAPETIVSRAQDSALALQSIDNWNSDATSFKDLYNNNGKVILYGEMDCGNKGDWDGNVSPWGILGDLATKIKSRLTTLGNSITDILATSGMDKSKLSQAVSTVVNKYVQSGPVRHHRGNKGTDSKQAMKDECTNFMDSNPETTKSRITEFENTRKKDSYVYMINIKDFVDDIIAEYQKLAA